jgi:hypothetical protein
LHLGLGALDANSRQKFRTALYFDVSTTVFTNLVGCILIMRAVDYITLDWSGEYNLTICVLYIQVVAADNKRIQTELLEILVRNVPLALQQLSATRSAFDAVQVIN